MMANCTFPYRPPTAPPDRSAAERAAARRLDLRHRLAHARAAWDRRAPLRQPALRVEVYYNGRLLPKRVLNEGRVLVVTVPAMR